MRAPSEILAGGARYARYARYASPVRRHSTEGTEPGTRRRTPPLGGEARVPGCRQVRVMAHTTGKVTDPVPGWAIGGGL